MLPHVERVRVDGPVGRVLERIYTLLTAIVRSRTLLTWEFTTLSVVANTFPVTVPFRAFAPRGVTVARVEDLSDPTTTYYDAVWCHWVPTDGGFEVRYVSGLSASTKYRLTLEVRSE